MNPGQAMKSLLTLPAPIIQLADINGVSVSIKREDLIHQEVSGNKFWKLFFNLEEYLTSTPKNPLVITFGGAFSNHIAATAALGKLLNIKTLGIIRGEELANEWQQNPTLAKAAANGMEFKFISRTRYRDKENFANEIENKFPDALIIPEGGTNENAVEGIRFMVDERTKHFDYLCCPVGTGGTVAGISKFAAKGQKVLGFKVVNDDSLFEKVFALSGSRNFELIEAADGGYGKIKDETVDLVNDYYAKYEIPLEPIYTGKMMRKLLEMIDEGYFEKGTKILAFHTGGLQGIDGANNLLKQTGRKTIKF